MEKKITLCPLKTAALMSKIGKFDTKGRTAQDACACTRDCAWFIEGKNYDERGLVCGLIFALRVQIGLLSECRESIEFLSNEIEDMSQPIQ